MSTFITLRLGDRVTSGQLNRHPIVRSATGVWLPNRSKSGSAWQKVGIGGVMRTTGTRKRIGYGYGAPNYPDYPDFPAPDFRARISAPRAWLSEQEAQAAQELEPEPLDLDQLIRETLFVNGETTVSGSVGKFYRVLREANPQFGDEFCATGFREWLDEQCKPDEELMGWTPEGMLWVKLTWPSKRLYTLSTSPFPAKVDPSLCTDAARPSPLARSSFDRIRSLLSSSPRATGLFLQPR